jgi:twinkle protein
MTANEIAARMAQDAEGICRHLLPAGKVVGKEYCVGDVDGSPGQSLKICLSGVNIGRWGDFNGGEQTGDMIGLVIAVNKCSVKEAIDFGKKWCNIKDEKYFADTPRKKIVPIPPLKDESNSPAVAKWFADRKICLDVVEQYRIVSNGGVISFPCYVGDDLIHVKYRDISKPKKESFRVSQGSSPILFGWQAIPRNARDVVIAEGEPDCLCYAQEGYAALSVPMGAGVGMKQQWIDLDWDRLEHFDTIYLSMDMDDAGQGCVQSIAQRLGLHRVKIISLPKKDANECVMAGLSLESYVADAKTLDPVELKRACEFVDEVEEKFRPTREDTAGKLLPWRGNEEKFRIRPGELTVWTGFNGSGKSMVLSDVTAGMIPQGERICIASMEMSPADTMKRMFQQIGVVDKPTQEYLAKMNDWLWDSVWIVNIRGTAKADKLLDIFRYAWKRYGITQVIIDSLLKCGFAEDDYNGQKEFVDKICDFIAETRCHVHLVSHARKLENEAQLPGKMDVRGGAALTDLPDNVITVWRNKPKEEKVNAALNSATPVAVLPEVKNKPDCIVQVHKQRHFDWEGKINLFFDKYSHRYYSWGDTPKAYV